MRHQMLKKQVMQQTKIQNTKIQIQNATNCKIQI